METTEKPAIGQTVGQLVRKGTGALALRSATLVARGLHDLSRESNWTRKPAFVGSASKVTISGTGAVCAISAETRSTPARVVIHELHNSFGQLALAVPGETAPLAKHLPAAFRGLAPDATSPERGAPGSLRFMSSISKARSSLGRSESSSTFPRTWRGHPTPATSSRPAPAENQRHSDSGPPERPANTSRMHRLAKREFLIGSNARPTRPNLARKAHFTVTVKRRSTRMENPSPV